MTLAMLSFGGKVAAQAPEPTLTANPSFDNSTIYYLYNVEAKAFIIGANDWGTQASLSKEYGYQFKLESVGNGEIRLSNRANNSNDWKYLFLDTDEINLFLDYNNNGYYGHWKAIKIDDTDRYTITYTNNESKNIRWRGDWSNTRLYFEAGSTGNKWGFVAVNDYKVYRSQYLKYISEQNIARPTRGDLVFYEEASTNSDAALGWKLNVTGTGEGGYNYQVKDWGTDFEGYGFDITSPFVEYWTGNGNLLNATISRQLSGFQPGIYTVSLNVLISTNNSDNGLRFSANGIQYSFTPTGNQGGRSWREFSIPIRVQNDGKIDLAITLNNVNFNWLVFKNLKVTFNAFTTFEHYAGIVSEMGTPPTDLAVDYKTSTDDSRLTTGVTLQRAHEYTHDIYVLPGDTYQLEPFSDFHTRPDNYGYLQRYVRWYDYKTDKSSERLTFSTDYCSDLFDFNAVPDDQYIPIGFKVTDDTGTHDGGYDTVTGSRKQSFSDGSDFRGCLYFSPRGSSNDAVVSFGENYQKLNLPQGKIRVSFLYTGWEANKTPFIFSFYKEYNESNPLCITTLTPTSSHNRSTLVQDADVFATEIDIPENGNYIMKWRIASAQNWKGIAFGDIRVTSSPIQEVLNDKGYFGSTLLTGSQNNGAYTTYHAPDSNDEIYDVIAIDVSNVTSPIYGDTDQTKNYPLIEPTLQYRHIFVIHNAKSRANDLSETQAKNEEYVQTHKIKLMCPEGTPFQYRLDNYEYRGFGSDSKPTGLYYKKSDGTYGNIYHYRIETLKKNGSVYESLGWTIYGKAYNNTGAEIGNTGKTSSPSDDDEETVCNNMVAVNGYSLAYAYKCIEGYDRAIYIKNPQEGDYIIRIYAIESNDGLGYYDIKTADGQANLLLAEYGLTVLPKSKASLLTETELQDDQYEHQRPKVMENLYGEPTTEVNFDNIKVSECSLDSSGDGYYKWPWIWETSSYGFGYSERYDYNMYVIANRSSKVPYKINDDIRDRLYADTNGNEKGFFYYANAASDPTRMAVLDIGKNLCTNTRIYVSAWVNEFNNNNETANIVFSFKGVDTEGNETILSSYVSGYVPGGFNTLNGFVNNQNTTPDERGKWMHIYYSFVPDVPANSDFDHFIISLENNCTSSFGADYAIDDIRCFVRHPAVYAHQTTPVCNGEKATKLIFSADFDQLIEALVIPETDTAPGEEKSLYYCFLNKEKFETALESKKNTDGTYQSGAYEYAFDAALVKGSYGSGADNYGIFTFSSHFDSNELKSTIGSVRTISFKDIDISDDEMKLDGTYIVAMVDPKNCTGSGTPKTPTPADFDITSKCSYTSEFKIILSSIIKIDGVIDTELDGASVCANQKPTIKLDLNGIAASDGDVLKTENANFDWYFGSVDDYNNAEFITDNNETVSLNEAIVAFRAHYPSAKQDDFQDQAPTGTDPATDYTADMKDCITYFLGNNSLKLYQESSIVSLMDHFHGIGENEQQDFYVTIIPINPHPERTDIEYCLDAFEVHLTISSRHPIMKDGSDNNTIISYPTVMRDIPLRIGLNQLKTCQMTTEGINGNVGKKLMVPLREVTPVTANVTTLIKDPKDDYVYIAASDDPNIADGKSGALDAVDEDNNVISELKCIGRLQDITAQIGAVTGSNICHIAFFKNFKFREGYSYTIKFHFLEQGAHSGTDVIVEGDVCPGDVVMTIKVVPEYQMWTGEVSRNWNDDRNWRRVTREELFNPTTEDVGDDFVITEDANSNTKSFVPADFTKVIIPDATTVKYMPYMYDLRYTDNLTKASYAGSGNSDYIITTASNNSAIADVPTTTYGEGAEAKDADISYEMSSIDLISGDVACRSWYDHTCEQIHFMSGALIMDQRYLHYNKAWADIELEPGRWQTIASPIANVVAGDFYLPTDGARQNTPLFQDITYNTSLNDRFKPAVFQRTWNAGKATVYELNSGNVSENNVAMSLDWSQVYNDVNVRYNSGKGFAIKPDVSMLDSDKQPSKVKFRFPKADIAYTYYNPNNKDGTYKTEEVNSIDISNVNNTKKRIYKLVDINNDYMPLVGDSTTLATNMKYFLIGNPFMCYLDMNKFFEENTNLVKKYWIVTEAGQRTAIMTNTDGAISTDDNGNFISTDEVKDPTKMAPGQSFFVELSPGVDETKSIRPKFTSEMMTYKDNDGVIPSDNPNGGEDGSQSDNAKTRAYSQNYTNNILYITASDGKHKNIALLTDGKKYSHEGAEMLIDSNLDEDLFVYAAVNGQCMSIGQINEGDTIPVAVIRPAISNQQSTDDIVMTIKGADTFGFDLYLIDSELGTTTLIDSDLTLDANTNGIRYYICSKAKGKRQDTAADYNDLPRLTVSASTITAYAPQSEPINNMSIYSANGMLIESFSIDSAQQKSSTILATGTYLVKVVTPSYEHTYKLLVK